MTELWRYVEIEFEAFEANKNEIGVSVDLQAKRSVWQSEGFKDDFEFLMNAAFEVASDNSANQLEGLLGHFRSVALCDMRLSELLSALKSYFRIISGGADNTDFPEQPGSIPGLSLEDTIDSARVVARQIEVDILGG